MALILEDGSGLVDAESYISVSDADDYHEKRGNSAWAALTEPQKEAALRKGADHMVRAFRTRWKGTRLTAPQALDWPREFVIREDYYVTGSTAPDSVDGNFYYPSDEIPLEIKRANAELALRSISNELSPDLGAQVRSEKVDVISITYEPGARQSLKFQLVEDLLSPFLSGHGGSVKLIRG